MPRITSVKSRQLTVTAPDQTKERVVARLGSLANATYSISAAANNIDEESSLTLTVDTGNVRNSSAIRWRILDRPADFVNNQGTVSVVSFEQQEALYTSAGTYSWVCPPGVTSVSVLCIGAGGGGGSNGAGSRAGGGGGLRWRNNISVTPGQTYTVTVPGAVPAPGNNPNAAAGPNGGDAIFGSTEIVWAQGGRNADNGGTGGGGSTIGGDIGGGNGGQGGAATDTGGGGGGGGGAGGYTGNGGNGGSGGNNANGNGGSGAVGNGGGGGGGGGGGDGAAGGCGGGVGIYGFGANGSAGAAGTNRSSSGTAPRLTDFDGGNGSGATVAPTYGGGGSGGGDFGFQRSASGSGAVRIIWGEGRSFPSTLVGVPTNSSVTFTVTPTADLLLEGTETFRVQLEKLTGTVLAVTDPITINDTSATVLTVTPDETTVDEGDTVTFTVNLVSGTYPPGTLLYWTASSSQDFVVGSGSFTLSEGTATFTATLKLDLTEEGTETVTVSLRSTSIEGTILVTSDPITVNDTSVPTYAITPAALNVNEGSSLNFTVNTTGISNGTTLYWSASSADISPQSGSFIVNGNTGSFAVTPSRDATTEGSETFTVSVRTGSASGTIRATSSSITINDTSLDPTYTVTPAQNSVNEGSSLTFDVSTTDVFDDTTLYWTVTNSGDFGTSSGSFSINNNAGSFSVTPTADLTTEGSETFTVSIRTGSISGNVVANSSSVTIVDTSTTPTFEYLLIAGGGGGGSGGENGGPGGGGAGGYRTGFGTLTTGINYTVSIGGGGSISARGGDSYISGSPLTESPSGAGTNTIKSYGGGFGGRDASGAQAGASGGSGGGGGGGGWGGSYAGGAGNTPETDPSQGNNGGSSNFFGASDNGAGGGGGGAGDVGSNASGNNGGNGGAGAASSITGTEVTRAGGGGGRPRGGSAGTGGIGGAGGGGNAGSPGATNTGGGGGGGNVGGSGVIILKYPNTYTISNPGGGLTLATDTTSVAGFKITTITVGTGNIQFA